MKRQAKKHELLLILSKIMRAAQQGQNTVVVKKQKYQYFAVLKILYDSGFIKGFEEKSTFLFLKLRHTWFWKGEKGPYSMGISNIEKLRKKKKKHTMSSKHIKSLLLAQSPAWVVVCSTQGGIMTGKEASLSNMGGQGVFKIA